MTHNHYEMHWFTEKITQKPVTNTFLVSFSPAHAGFPFGIKCERSANNLQMVVDHMMQAVFVNSECGN